MVIKFENGSEIHSIETNGDSKRGYVRGRRLSDREYKYMITNEQVMAEEKLDKSMKILGLK